MNTSTQELELVLERLAQARAQLRATPVAQIVDAIASAAQTIDTARDDLVNATGYSPETIDEILAHLRKDWSKPSLLKLLQSEVGDARMLDTVVDGRFARGPDLTFHIFSGNVPGVAVTSLIRALLVKSPSLGKLASAEPILPVHFVNALQNVAPAIANAVAVRYWQGGNERLERIAMDAADAIVVYGGEETVNSIRSRIDSSKRLLIHGPKISFGVVGPAPAASTAREIARAVATYDQQGCVSPHVVFAMRNAKELAAEIAAELDRLTVELPRRKLGAAEAIAIREIRTMAEFREISGDDVAIFASADTAYTVIYDANPALTPSCLNRTLHVHPVDSIAQLGRILDPHRAFLQSAGIAGFADSGEVAQALFDKGVTRISSFPDLPWPPMDWFHDGRGPLNELLTYCTASV